ncbi:MAG TPA: HNH endonuclease [Candidatus Polarisedimenticolia bacterium]|jgi:putative restriction endonuclease
MTAEELDTRVRLEAFKFLRHHRGELHQKVLLTGFQFEGIRVPLMSPQGIFKPAILPEVPLTIRTAPEVSGRERPYDDDFGPDETLLYRYRGTATERMHPDNVGLRLAMERGKELIYLFGTHQGWYLPIWPVQVVHDDPDNLLFTVDLSRKAHELTEPCSLSDPDGSAPFYVPRTIQQRVQQARFSGRVLRAYQVRCAVCRLGHKELIEAAHILPYGHPRGASIVPNGLALCRLHHGAFDGNLLGIRPDLVIELQDRILEEEDGPMLVHGLQGFHQQVIHVPRTEGLKPRREFLEERYALFKKAV